MYIMGCMSFDVFLVNGCKFESTAMAATGEFAVKYEVVIVVFELGVLKMEEVEVVVEFVL